MKKEKIGLTPINWFLSILGIIVLSCLIILPPVFRTVFKEEKPIELPEETIIEKLTCTKNDIVLEGYTGDITYSFSYYQDQIQNYSKKTVSTYTDYVLYDNDKQTFGRYTAAFNILAGYEYVMEPNDETYMLTINEDYDLTTFNNTTITIPGDTEETKVTSLYTMSDSMNQIKNNLINDGYTCK